MIYTFYSYKGGVGRSMAMANVGELFYQVGLNVLLVDWDLEAPGLERFFARGDEKTAAQPGVIDLLLDYKHQVSQEWTTEDGQYPFAKPSDLVIDLHPNSPKGGLWLLTAGQRDKANFARYANAVLTFGWKDFYDNWEGEAYFEWLREQFLAMADVVLIDSRTGITEMGGVCTYQLGDVVTMFCGTSQQSLDGTERMVTELKSSAVEEARVRALEVVVIPARVDKESGVGDEFKREFLKRFARYTPAIFNRNSDYFWQLKIPYATVCAYKEMIVTPESSVGSEDLYQAFNQLAFALSRLTSNESAIRKALPEKKFQLGSKSVVGATLGENIIITGDGARVIVGREPVNTSVIDYDTALEHYLEYVISRNRYLQLQGIRSGGKLVSIELEHIYITLRATRQRTVTGEECWLDAEAELAPGEHTMRRGVDMGTYTRSETITVSVNEALATERRLVILGDPGSGKTTLLRYLTVLYARNLATGDDLVRSKLELDEHARLPILIPLRRLGAYLKSRHPADGGTDGPSLLLQYLLAMLEAERLELPLDFFDFYLENGQAAVFLDGLDDVADPDLRRRVSRIVEAFTVAYPRCRYVVTSRIIGYTGAARLGENYAVTTIRDFTDADMNQFLRNWHLAVAIGQMGPGESAQVYAAQQTRQLCTAIANNERIRELAINPLMLTVIALVHRDRVKLPDRRVELYTEAVEVLLGKWDEARGVQETAVLADRPFDTGDKRLLLQQIALAMHEKAQKELEVEDLRHLVGDYLQGMLTDWQEIIRATERFVRVIEERTGLLVARGPGIYSFSHLTFQEYLTALSVAARDNYIEYTLQHSSDPWWREVILLEAGYLSTQSRERTTRLIQAIATCKEEPEPYHNLVLAAECFRDVGEGRVDSTIVAEIQQQLRRELERPMHISLIDKIRQFFGTRLALGDFIQRRAFAATALARIENSNSEAEPAFWKHPYGEPTWIEIPSGEFWMGSERDTDKGRPLHKVYLNRYWAARTPTTNTQYRLFIEASGYKPPDYWHNGYIPKGLEGHPVVNVSWQDALAYCAWLSEVTNKLISLPSEAEWEKAARGAEDKREFPWGNEWHKEHCNTKELKIEETTPVGIFPEGASPYNMLEMAGNVWEWTQSLLENYPYQPDDGREDLELGEKADRVIRGGAFDVISQNARCSTRRAKSPNTREPTIGFRVVAHMTQEQQ